MLWMAHVGSTRVNFKPQGAHPGLKRAQYRSKRGPLKVNNGKQPVNCELIFSSQSTLIAHPSAVYPTEVRYGFSIDSEMK